MNFSEDILEELNTISPLLAGIEKNNVFSVPDGYFSELSMDIFKRINTEFKTDRLTVPEGYFENLSATILNKIKAQEDNPSDELRTLSPMLYSIQNENVFTVPAGYFRNLEYDIMDKVRPQAKVISLKRNSIWRYAAAAVVTGVIGLSSLMMFNKSQQSTGAGIDEAINTASKFKNEQQINGAIATLSDDEIIKYLDRTGDALDNETLATSVDESELPATQDYLLEENTLETYLDKTNKDSQN